MRLSEWLTGLRQRFSRRSTTRVPARLRRRRKPQCLSGHQSEQLEDRTLLSIESIAASDANAEESNGMVSDPGTVQVTRTDSLAADLTVNYTIAGSATNGTDYEILAGNVVIAAGASSADIVVMPIDDLESEGNETVILTLSTSSAYTVDADKNTSTVIIADDEGPVEVSLLAWDPDAAEWDSEAQLPDPGYFSVTRSGPTTDSLAVNYSITGTATNGSDYQSISSPVTIPAGESFKDIQIDPIDDSVCEGEESVVLTLSTGTGYTIDSDLDSGTVTIEDNDTPPTPVVSISATDDTAKEYSQDTGTFTFTRTEDTCLPLTVNYNVGGDATSGTDYSPLFGSVLFAVGDQNATVTVTPTDDTVAELTETVKLTITLDSSYTVGSSDSATVSIVDNDTKVSVSASDDPTAFEDGQQTGTFKISRDGYIEEDLLVKYTLGGDATNGTDYSLLTGSVQIDADDTYVVVTITPTNDTVAEPTETVEFTILSEPTYTRVSPFIDSVSIVDNDTVVTLSASDADAAESGLDPGQFTVSRSGFTGENLVVNYTTTGTATSDSDYTALSGNVTILAGSSTAVITVSPHNDNTVESAETVIATMDSAATYTVGSPASGTVMIADNDSTVTVLATDADAHEAGLETGTFTLSRSGYTAEALTVNFTISGTATEGADYSTLARTATFAAGATTTTVTVTPVDDADVEPTETVILTLASGTDYEIGSSSSSTVDIVDNCTFITVSATDDTAYEDGQDTGTFAVTREGETSEALTVNYTIAGTATSGSDYTAIAGSVTIVAGASSAWVTVTPINDTAAEPTETVVLTIDPAVTYEVGSPSSDTVNIVDNDTVITVTASDANAYEAGEDPGTFTVSREGYIGEDLEVNYAVTGTARPGDDYTALTGTVTILAGAVSATVTVLPNDDNWSEGDETVDLSINSALTYTLGSQSTDTVTLIDETNDPDPVLTIDVTDDTAIEANGDTGSMTVSRTGDTSAELTVFYSVGGTATSASDYSPLMGSLTFAAGSDTSAPITISPVDDQVAEPRETVVATLTGNTAYDLRQTTSGTVTILDNDTTVSISATDPDAAEAGPDAGEFSVSRSGDTTEDLIVVYTVGGTATADDDYQALTGVVIIAADESSATVSVDPIDDNWAEGSETVTATLSMQPTYALGQTTFDTITIADDASDSGSVVTLEASDPAAAETGAGGSPDPGTFKITRTGSTSSSLTVTYSVDGTATAGADYASLTGSVVIAATETEVTFDVDPIQDNWAEGSETVDVTLSSSADYNLGSTTAATVTIADEAGDTGAVVTIAATDPTAAEQGQDLGTFELSRSGDLSGPLAVVLAITGSATNGTDYNSLGTTATFPANQATVNLTVTPVDDGTAEATETVVVTLATDPAYLVGSSDTATVSITDDDSVLSIEATDAEATETAPGISADPGTFTITRSGNLTEVLTVGFAVVADPPGTNLLADPRDYLLSSTGSVTIAANQASATVTLSPVDDNLFESPEELWLELTAGHYTIDQANSQAFVTIDDNAWTIGGTDENGNLIFSNNIDLCSCTFEGVEVDPKTGQLRLNIPSSLGLDGGNQFPQHHSSENPHPIVGVDVNLPNGVPPSQIEAEVTFGGVEMDPVTYSVPVTFDAQTARIALQSDASTLETGQYDYDVRVTFQWARPEGGQFTTTTERLSGTTQIINRSQSEFGNRFWVRDLDRLYPNSTGMTLIRGDGTAAVNGGPKVRRGAWRSKSAAPC